MRETCYPELLVMLLFYFCRLFPLL